MSSYKHVIFDFDGTLVDSAPVILDCFQAVLDKHQIEPVIQLSPNVIGPPLKQTLSTLSGLREGAQLDALANDFKRIYDDRAPQSTQPYPGVFEVLTSLRRSGHILHIATNKRLQPTLAILDALAWTDFFLSVYAQDSRLGGYPSKQVMIECLLEENGIEASSAIYVGDTQEDGRAAMANGLDFLGADWGYGGVMEGWTLPNAWQRASVATQISSQICA